MAESLEFQDETKHCWNRIGVWGDATCVELNEAVHCQNCPVYAAAGRSLLDREAPSGYLSEWTHVVAGENQDRVFDTVSALVFRLQKEWLALPTQLFKDR
jgi:chemotaxis-related protein WspD